MRLKLHGRIAPVAISFLRQAQEGGGPWPSPESPPETALAMTSDSLPHQGSAFRAYGATERAGLNTGGAHSPSEPKVSPGSLCTA